LSNHAVQVIAAFLASSFITFIAIVVGYLTYSLDGNLTNGLDEIAVKSIRRLLHMGDGDDIHSTTREVRNKAMTRFILILSDQQLVTGLAILITGYSQRCSLDGYHFTVIATLAWFSSTTHLSTLSVLHAYLVDHPVVKTWRVIGMIGVLGMLFHAELYTQQGLFSAVPIQCTFARGFPHLVAVNGQESLYLTVFSTSWVAILAYLFFAYCNNIVRLYAKGPSDSLLTLSDEFLRRGAGLNPPLSRVDKASKWLNTAKYGGINNFFVLFFFLWGEFLDSFLWEIVWLAFGNTFGVAQIYLWRWVIRPPNLTGSENSMSFGQTVAVLLLALPILAAGEVYYGMNVSVPSLFASNPVSLDVKQADSPPREGLRRRSSSLHLSHYNTGQWSLAERRESTVTEAELFAVKGTGIGIFLIVFVTTVCLILFGISFGGAVESPSFSLTIVPWIFMIFLATVVLAQVVLILGRILCDLLKRLVMRFS
jgi:hypothetical protein